MATGEGCSDADPTISAEPADNVADGETGVEGSPCAGVESLDDSGAGPDELEADVDPAEAAPAEQDPPAPPPPPPPRLTGTWNVTNGANQQIRVYVRMIVAVRQTTNDPWTTLREFAAAEGSVPRTPTDGDTGIDPSETRSMTVYIRRREAEEAFNHYKRHADAARNTGTHTRYPLVRITAQLVVNTASMVIGAPTSQQTGDTHTFTTTVTRRP